MSVIRSNFNPTNDFKSTWITDKIDATGIDYLENFGYWLCDKKSETDKFAGFNAMTTSQIRNIFGEVKRIELKVGNDKDKWQKEKSSFLLLRPKIAYAAARVLTKSQHNKIKDFRTVIELAHREVKDDVQHFINFSQFLEGIIAYHKVYGGKD